MYYQGLKVMRFLLILLAAAVFSCSKPVELKTGTWRGVIDCQGHDLPFTFDVVREKDSLLVYLKNGSEKILLDEVSIFGDSVKMVLHIFDAELRAKIDGDKLTGTFVKNYATQANQPFSATFGEDYRFAKNTSEKTADSVANTRWNSKPPKEKLFHRSEFLSKMAIISLEVSLHPRATIATWKEMWSMANSCSARLTETTHTCSLPRSQVTP